MFGFGDYGVTAAYLLTILSAVVCLWYGIKHWNSDDAMPAVKHGADENLDFEDEI